MDLSLDQDQSVALRTMLDDALGDLSHEIADTDNPTYREELRARRDRLREIRGALGT